MRTTVVTGAAGGMGQAIRKYLEAKGERVIGVDVRDAEVIADLSSAEGRTAMIAEIDKVCGGKLDGVVAGAGISDRGPGGLISSVNYFGAVATLEGLRPMLARSDSPRAIAISSHSMIIVPVVQKLLDAYAGNDEAGAIELSKQLADAENGIAVYASAKFALASWVREQAIKPDWIGNGIALNAIAPGVITTPMTNEEDQKQIFALGDDIYPVPAKRAGTAEEIAGLVGYLLSEIAGYMCGTVINIDGGTEPALRRADSPSPRAIV